MSKSSDRLAAIRNGLIGADRMLATPFGLKPFLYADYTASGRALTQVERQIERLMADYANPHSEDSATGRASNRWMREAEMVIRKAVNAASDDCLLPCAAGATGAIHKLQEILGLAVAPASRDALGEAVLRRFGEHDRHTAGAEEATERIASVLRLFHRGLPSTLVGQSHSLDHGTFCHRPPRRFVVLRRPRSQDG